jgi:hypothetical protein
MEGFQMEAKPINYPFDYEPIKNKNDNDQLQLRIEELASIAAINREWVSKGADLHKD